MVAYESIKRHKHARRHDKIEEVFSTLLQDSPSLNNEALFCKVIRRLAAHSFGGLEGSELSFSAPPSATLSWKVDEAQ